MGTQKWSSWELCLKLCVNQTRLLLRRERLKGLVRWDGGRLQTPSLASKHVDWQGRGMDGWRGMMPKCLRLWAAAPKALVPLCQIRCHRATDYQRDPAHKADCRTTARKGCMPPNLPISVYVVFFHPFTWLHSIPLGGEKTVSISPDLICTGTWDFSTMTHFGCTIVLKTVKQHLALLHRWAEGEGASLVTTHKASLSPVLPHSSFY